MGPTDGWRGETVCRPSAVPSHRPLRSKNSDAPTARESGADISMSLLGSDRAVEVKCRAAGFRQLYDWLDRRDVLIVKSDRQEPLVVVRLSLAAEIAKRTV
jgi:hypothetical protein